MDRLKYRKLILKADIQEFKVLLQDGLDVNQRLDRLKRTPLMYSLDTERYNIFNFFIENGADPTLEDYVGGDIFDYLEEMKFFFESGNCCLDYYDVQKRLIEQYPSTYKRLKDTNLIHSDIKKEFYYLNNINELNLL